jgi:F-type H+-transporting ATPase subunit delta
MSELMTLARPYAVAAYQRAKETSSTAQWEDMLAFLADALDDPLLRQAASNPLADKDQFLAALFDLCQGELNEEGQNFLRLLVHNHRLGLMPSIRTLFSHYRAEDEGYIDVSVATAFPLASDEEQDIAAIVENLVKRQARLTVHQDESLIGGVVIRAGDRVIDGSVRGQLQRLEKTLWN